ncbi:hypothetical protein [Streptomyces halstedii]|uniref:hypothetical protein n=1 Tax=Streptomyces halstedii TaxID=1944 RepID=UPI0036AAA1AC
MSPARRFVDSRDDQDDAYALAFQLAPVLVRAGLTERYGEGVTRVRGTASWGVYLTDRTPELPPPAGLAFVSRPRTSGLRAAA